MNNRLTDRLTDYIQLGVSVCVSILMCISTIHLFFYFSYQEVFHRFDKDQSGDMNLFELRDALSALGKTVTIFFVVISFLLISLFYPFLCAFLYNCFLLCRLSTQQHGSKLHPSPVSQQERHHTIRHIYTDFSAGYSHVR